MKASKLASAFKYLDNFFKAHHREHRIMITKVGGAKYGPGREPYEGHNEAIGFIRDAVFVAEANFNDLSIPKGFVSPKKFIETVEAYRDMLDSHAENILDFVKTNDGEWHTELTNAFTICSKTRDAMDHVIELAEGQSSKSSLQQLIRILERLPKVSRSISGKNRYAGRKTLEISDEYDVQNLLHGVLHIAFDDIRPEVPCPDHGGVSTRTDFFLPSAGIMIEVKYSRKGKKQSTILNELIVDIAHYKKYPGIKQLVCYIWDTEHNLKNAIALKTDLEKSNKGFITVVVAS